MLWLQCEISPKGYYVSSTWSLAGSTGGEGSRILRGEVLLKVGDTAGVHEVLNSGPLPIHSKLPHCGCNGLPVTATTASGAGRSISFPDVSLN